MIRRKMKKIRVLMVGAALLLLCGNDAIAQTNISQNHDTLRLTIDQALEIALSDNQSIKIAEAELERVDYLKKESWYALLPDLNTTMQYTNNIYKQIFFSDFFPGGKMEVGSTHS
jgi:outer membrane protein TolC